MKELTLVTGGRGFIGRHLVDALLRRSAPVRVLDLEAPQDPSPGVDYHTGSVTDPAAVAAAMDGVGRVFHLAARAGLWQADPAEMFAVNQQGTRCVLQAAERAGVERIVHCSTESILKSRLRDPASGVIDETVQPPEAEMCGAYCVAKLRAEQEALAAARRGLPVVVVNPSVPVGPGDVNLTPPSRMLLGFVNGRFPAYLDSVLNLVDARDVAEGHLLAAERGRVGERYLLGHENIRLADLLALLEELTGLPMPRRRVPYWLAFSASAVQEWMADHVTHRRPAAPLTGVRLARTPMCFDNRKARQELGLSFRPLRASLADALDDFAARGLLESELRRPAGG